MTSSSSPSGRGRFITLEGGEGAGKSTQARLLADALGAAGGEVVFTREPGGTPNAELLRTLLLDRGKSWSADAEILLHFAARAEHVAGVIAPALARGATVVCDRFFDSTLAYQGWGMGADRDLIAALSARLPVQPDVTFVLTIPSSARRGRLRQRAGGTDRYEAEDDAFHARVAAGFSALAQAAPERCIVVDASGTVEHVHGAMTTTLERFSAERWPG